MLDKLQLSTNPIHRAEGEDLNLSDLTPVVNGTFLPGNGWQEVMLQKPAAGRFVCIEALDALNGSDVASIAEFYVLGADGKRISREPWKVTYADSEDVKGGNHLADKIFDLQESTYWSSVPGNEFPHHVVIDLGESQDISGFQFLPRMEQEVPGAIGNFRVYIMDDPHVTIKNSAE